MHHTRPAKITSDKLTLDGVPALIVPVALIVGVVGIGAAMLLSFDFSRFSHIYLVNYAYFLSLCIGCLFFVTITHLVRAGWNVTVRRVAELYAMCLLPMAILFLPILIPLLVGSDDLYSWNAGGWSVMHDSATAEQISALPMAERPPLEQMKAAFLNPTFFAIRWVIYFAVWSTMAWYFLSGSLRQDQTGDKSVTSRMQAFAAPGMIFFAATIVFSSFDLLMSLEPLWFSTMFPVYFFAGAVLSSLALITLTCMLIQGSGRVTDEITPDHYHDLGKLMHGFVVFWGYIAFSQFLLIWYANIPEETFWYDYRINNNGWQILSLVLLIGHLFVPFLAIMARTVRRNRNFMMGAAIYLLVMHWIDYYWLVMPQFNRDTHELTGATGILVDVLCTVGMLGLFVAIARLVTRDKPLVPLQDPRLGQALNHEVV